MRIYPSIDILGGRCVRLEKGDYRKVTTYSGSPLEYALLWQEKGARCLHLVDLDGARDGCPVNRKAIEQILRRLNIPVQVGGGIRTLDHAREVFSWGANRVVTGTGAFRNREFLESALAAYGEQLVIGIDARDGMVAIDGWETTSKVSAVEFALEMEYAGVKSMVYTDISRDGMLSGPNLDAMATMASAVSMEVIASGGVGERVHLDGLFRTGVAGVIVGKALYEKRIRLEEVVDAYEADHSMP